MPTYKLLALDMDGTLLTSDKSISTKTSAALRKAAEAGTVVTLSTGRAAAELLDYQAQIDGVVRYGALLSGTVIWDFAIREALSAQFLDPKLVEAIVSQGLAENAMVQMFDTGCAVMCHHDVARMHEVGQGIYQGLAQRRGTLVNDIGAYAREHAHEICKINLHHVSRASMETSWQALESLPLQLAVGEFTSLEATPLGVTKAIGLEWLCRHLGIGLEETIVVGDGDNDLEVMEIAGLAVAMGNANPDVKARAGAVVADNDHDGIVDVIDRWLGCA